MLVPVITYKERIVTKLWVTFRYYNNLLDSLFIVILQNLFFLLVCSYIAVLYLNRLSPIFFLKPVLIIRWFVVGRYLVSAAMPILMALFVNTWLQKSSRINGNKSNLDISTYTKVYPPSLTPHPLIYERSCDL